MHAPLPFPGLPPSPVFENQTVRMIVRPTIGGERVRIRLSNAFGTSALKIGAAHIAIAAQDAKTVPESDHALTFGGDSSISIPPGAPVLSDAVDLHVSQSSEIAVSLFLPEQDTFVYRSFLGTAQDATFRRPAISAAKAEMPNATRECVMVLAGGCRSIGVRSSRGNRDVRRFHHGWSWGEPGRLHRLARPSGESPGKREGAFPLAVVNEGIGGNRILRDGAGVSALARLIATFWHSRGSSA